MASGGTEATELDGKPVILLTTVGARTGKLRKTPLMRVENNGHYAIVASATVAAVAEGAVEACSPASAAKHPFWYYNVKKNPRVELQDGPVTGDYDAHEVFGDVKAIWWNRAIKVWPDYAMYFSKTGFHIPMFVLVPAGC
jgi:F420H(2)-dependent quinone reductase